MAENFDFQDNHCLEALELALYSKISDLLAVNNFDDALKVVGLMKEVGIV